MQLIVQTCGVLRAPIWSKLLRAKPARVDLRAHNKVDLKFYIGSILSWVVSYRFLAVAAHLLVVRPVRSHV